MDRRLVQMSKTISHALRHAPHLYGLELGDEGWVSVSALLTALRNDREEWRNVTIDDIAAIIEQSDKRRFEMRAGQIRALYGYSVSKKISKTPAVPPETLFHGTSKNVISVIRAEGLKPMARQYVHLSVDRETAQQVARRKRGQSVILTIHADMAHQNGVRFYRGNELVWLADQVPPTFIEIPQ